MKILFIDDEELIIEVAAIALKRAGVDVLCSDSGPAGLLSFHKYQEEISLVICDLNMVGMHGLEVVRVIKTSKPSMRIVVSTGFITTDERKQLNDLGVTDILYKPYRMEELTELVKKQLAAS